MTVEQPKEDLRGQLVEDSINVIRVFNVMLGSKKLTEKEKKKIAEFFDGMFKVIDQ